MRRRKKKKEEGGQAEAKARQEEGTPLGGAAEAARNLREASTQTLADEDGTQVSHSTDDGSGALRGEFNSFRGFQSDGPRGSRARAEVKAAFAEMMEEIGKSAWGRRLADRETLMEKTRSQWGGDPLPYEYWMKPTEIFARALESVVSLRVDGYTSGYYAPYPTLEETLEPIVFHFFAELEEGVNETTGLATLYSTDTGASVGGDVVDAMEVLASGKDATLQNGKLGSILFPFGKMGKGGTGFLHIVERRMAQGHSLDEAVWIAAHVGEAAARGEDTLPEDGRPMYNTKWLDKDGYRRLWHSTRMAKQSLPVMKLMRKRGPTLMLIDGQLGTHKVLTSARKMWLPR